MIRTLISQRMVLISRTQFSSPFKYIGPSNNIPWYSRTLFKFSEQKKARLPRNKQQLWMQQQQKNLKESAPQDELAGKTHEDISKGSIIALSILTMGLISLFVYSYNKGKQNLTTLSTDISGLVQTVEEDSLIGGDWTLINSQGQPFSSRNLQGSYYLIFFGYTKSPDISPSTLFYLSSVYRIIRNLPEGAYLKFKIVFVSLDPERDTPNVIKKYLDNFGKQIIGVTGSRANDVELMECLRQFRIKFSRQAVKNGEPKDRYRIDHTSRVFLMDPDNKYIDYLDPNLTEHQTALAIMSKVAKNEHKKAKSVQKFKVS